VSEISYISGDHGWYGTLYRLSGTFLQNKCGTISLVCENQEKSWKHWFLTFTYKISKKRKGQPQPSLPEQASQATH